MHRPTAGGASTSSGAGYDIVLSSGFLAFAAHCGFLKAVEETGVPVAGIMGTSSGALCGSMFAAGYTATEVSACSGPALMFSTERMHFLIFPVSHFPPTLSVEQIAEELSRLPPIKRVGLSKSPWRGVLTLKPAARTLETLLPATFEDLQKEFAVGVVGSAGHELIASGSLAPAVVASAAVPVLFAPVRIPGSKHNPYIDGGVECRIGLDLWRRCRRGGGAQGPAVVHLIGRSSPFSGNDDTAGLGKAIWGKVEVLELEFKMHAWLVWVFPVSICLDGV